MTRTLLRFTLVATLAAACLAASDGWAQSPVKAGEPRPYFTATPRPYPVGAEGRPAVWTDVVRSSGATWLRLHFKNFDLAPGDYVVVQDPGGRESYRYEGRGPYGNGEFWSFSTDGDTAIVRLHGGREMGAGYEIVEIGHGTLPSLEPVAEVVCGTDGRKDVACYSTPPVSTWNPISRLLFQDADGDLQFYVCTGSLVAGSNASTLMTNNHCINSQADTNTLQARFNYQKANCKGNQQAAASNYNGGTFLITSSVTGGLDYTLLTLQGNPEGTWGEYTPTTVEPSAGSLMLFPQHPGGGLKKLGKFEDRQQTILCDVTAVNQTFGGSASGSQFSYGCDSEGGSSGSPILNGTATRVWGLHHFGGVNNCNNSATHMSDICAHAGSLLSCSSTL